MLYKSTDWQLDRKVSIICLLSHNDRNYITPNMFKMFIHACISLHSLDWEMYENSLQYLFY